MASTKQITANRGNAQHSTGPRTDDGKDACRANAVTHGLSSTLPVLPGEDASAYEAERRAWFERYQPVGPDQIDAVERAVAAVMGLRRCRRHEAMILERRAREARELFDEHQRSRVLELARELAANPAKAVLERTAAGCRYLIERWEQLEAELEYRAVWGPTHLVEALQLLGSRPIDLLDQAESREVAAGVLRLVLGDPAPIDRADLDAEELGALECERQAAERGPVLGWITPIVVGRGQRLPVGGEYALGTLAQELPENVEEVQAWLLEFIRVRLANYRDRLPELEARAEFEREESALEAGLLDDSKTGALRLRYVNAHQRALRHALTDLERLQRLQEQQSRQQRRQPDAVVPLQPTGSEAPEAPAPNKPNPPSDSDATPDDSTPYNQEAASTWTSGVAAVAPWRTRTDHFEAALSLIPQLGGSHHGEMPRS